MILDICSLSRVIHVPDYWMNGQRGQLAQSVVVLEFKKEKENVKMEHLELFLNVRSNMENSLNRVLLKSVVSTALG